ncbi:MAG: SCP2 sterol-binding domain-containing protein [Proteobacteria bacterium]|nr:SCP2 sterol-binding domain-containing protein [Pseudomonadota bacterium]
MRLVHTPVKLQASQQHAIGIPTVLSELLTEKQKMFESHFKPGLLQRTSTVFQFRFPEDEDFFLSVSAEEFSFNEGNATNPTLTLYLDLHDTCWELLGGTRDGMEAFMNGQYRADGNIVLSQLLLYLFKSDDPTMIFKVQD